ncbi:MAG: hypothetical protein MJZ15_11210 [Bacteroidales bacterium]|nr:hypothetical protein [Bacteroidales bacterium]
MVDIEKCKDIYEYAAALGVSVQELTIPQMAAWVNAGKAPKVGKYYVNMVNRYFAWGDLMQMNFEKAQSVMLQAILEDKLFGVFSLITEGVYAYCPKFTPDERFRFYVGKFQP